MKYPHSKTPILDWSNTADWYDRNAGAFSAGAAKGTTSNLCRTFLEGLPAGARVLDAGCGTGRDAAFMKSLNYNVFGIDPSAEMIKATRAAVPGISLRQIGFNEFHDGPGTWHAIWAMASMLHVPRAQFETCLEYQC
jgi:ubiquinone/menaquinone biosynthesis C-methylase UbiE